jgi:hypothetical protein
MLTRQEKEFLTKLGRNTQFGGLEANTVDQAIKDGIKSLIVLHIRHYGLQTGKNQSDIFDEIKAVYPVMRESA